MKPIYLPIKGFALAALLLCTGSAALAEEPKVDSVAIALPAAAAAAAEPAPVSPDMNNHGFDKPVAIATLDDARGGTEFVTNDMKLAGTTAGNVAINVGTGMNSITGGAFSNMSGLPVVIQNSGANVLIQNAMIVNLQIN